MYKNLSIFINRVRSLTICEIEHDIIKLKNIILEQNRTAILKKGISSNTHTHSMRMVTADLLYRNSERR